MVKIIKAAFLIAVLFIACSFNIEAKQIIVSKSGAGISSVKTALTKIAGGDTIIISAGIYKEHGIKIHTPVTIIGKNFPVIDGESLGQIFTIDTSNVSISGLIIQNTGFSSMDDLAGIRTQQVSHITISGNKFLNCCYAVFIAASDYCTIQNNFIKGNPANQQMAGNGIHGWQSINCEINHNEITGQRDGIYFEFVQGSTISNNHSYENMRYGLHFMFNDNNRFVQNLFENNGSGVAVMFSKNITMLNNTYRDNWGASAYGLLLKEINDSYVLYNHFEKNTAAVYMEGCNRIVFSRNDFIQNGWAIRVQASCMNNTIAFNNFLGNTFDIATNGSLSLNVYSGNYWEQYDGYDLNKNGIGDVPFRPVSVFSMFSENMPESMVMMRSFCVTLLDKIEKVIPGVIPEDLIDNSPMMKKINNAYPGSGT